MSQSVTQNQVTKLTCPRLPLAIYLEVIAHLRQINGVKAGLLPQKSSEFDYLQSQVGGLWLEYISSAIREQQIQGVLAYYEGKYGSWSKCEDLTDSL